MTLADNQLHAVLLLGGGGTRLWPLSTVDLPKQFLPLFDGKSLYQLTLDRIGPLSFRAVHVVTSEKYLEHAREQAKSIKIPVNFIVEPTRRDSGPAIAAAVATIAEDYGIGSTIVVFPCDHLIQDSVLLSNKLTDAILASKTSALVTLGVTPTSPSTEYGYIQIGSALANYQSAFEVISFKEKPDREAALSYLHLGNYLWNSGIFIFGAGKFIFEANLHMPQIWSSVKESVVLSGAYGNVRILDQKSFSNAEKISIDYALFEKSKNVVTIKSDFDWLDVGSWSAVHALSDKDDNGNAISGPVTEIDCENVHLVSSAQQVVAIGIKDIVVIVSDKGILVADINRSSNVKKIIDV